LQSTARLEKVEYSLDFLVAEIDRRYGIDWRWSFRKELREIRRNKLSAASAEPKSVEEEETTAKNNTSDSQREEVLDKTDSTNKATAVDMEFHS